MDETTVVTGLLTPQTWVGLGLILLVAYSWWGKLNTERSIGADFKELIENLQGQLSDLKEDLKAEREARQKAELDKNDAMLKVGNLTAEVQGLKTQIQNLQNSIEQLQEREKGLLDKIIKQ